MILQTRINYKKFSKFATVEEFNADFEQAMLYHKEKFTKSEYLALNKLRKFAFSESSPDTVGVAWSRGQIVVSATHKDSMFGISRSTFDRMLRKAKKLNLIKVINQYHDNGKQKHNVYVFNRFEELTPEKFEIVSKSHTIDVPKTIGEPITILLELPKIKDNNKTYSQGENVENEKVNKQPQKEKEQEPKTDYQRMKKKMAGLFKDKSMTYEMYGVWLQQTRRMIKKPPFSVALEGLHLLILEIKRRIADEIKPLNNPIGYYYGILNNLIDEWIDKRYYDDYAA